MSNSSTMITYGSQFIKVTDSGVQIQQKQEIMYDVDPSDITIPYDQITGVVLVEPTFGIRDILKLKLRGIIFLSLKVFLNLEIHIVFAYLRNNIHLQLK